MLNVHLEVFQPTFLFSSLLFWRMKPYRPSGIRCCCGNLAGLCCGTKTSALKHFRNIRPNQCSFVRGPRETQALSLKTEMEEGRRRRLALRCAATGGLSTCLCFNVPCQQRAQTRLGTRWQATLCGVCFDLCTQAQNKSQKQRTGGHGRFGAVCDEDVTRNVLIFNIGLRKIM